MWEISSKFCWQSGKKIICFGMSCSFTSYLNIYQTLKNVSILDSSFYRLYRVPRVSTEFRRHGIPSVFFTSVYSVFRAELAKNSAEFRRIPCHRIPWNSAEFHGIPWLFSCTVFRISLPVPDRYFLCVIICVSSKFLSLPFWGCCVY